MIVVIQARPTANTCCKHLLSLALWAKVIVTRTTPVKSAVSDAPAADVAHHVSARRRHGLEGMPLVAPLALNMSKRSRYKRRGG